MTKRFLVAVLISFYSFANASVNNFYLYSMDLTQVKDDKLKITLTVPRITKNEVIFRMPKIVPGTYDIYDFGRFVSEFQAFDSLGKPVTFEKLDVNSWRIADAKKLHTINYWVDDTWYHESQENFVFEPGGTNIEENESFVINTHGFFGYFDDMKKMEFRLSIKRPDNFYGATGLSDITTTGTTDLFKIEDYMQLVDSPIMYNIPDTATFLVGDARILVSVYSKNKVAGSKFVAENIKEILSAQKEYLGGKLPIDKYAFLIYLYSGTSGSGSSGALEHSYSSLYFLPEQEPEDLVQTLRDVASHEFFHIVTPLNIHSEEIGNFDYNNPEMSKHLWLYEGLTEYSAMHFQVKQGLMPMNMFLQAKVREKLYGADQFKDDLPFTEMSEGALDAYKDQYSNVYLKGALIGMCLDLKLRKLSDGKTGVQDLMRSLSDVYGKDKSFEDDKLFSEIQRLTYPEIGEFLARYVAGPAPLPIKEYLNYAGILYEEEGKVKGVTLGGFELGLDTANRMLLRIEDVSKMDAFGKKMGYQKGDVILEFNGTQLNLFNAQEVIGGFFRNAKEGDKITVKVQRYKKGKKIEKLLKGKVKEVEQTERHVIKPVENPTEDQLRIRKAWLGVTE